jgi:hypothetical protein
MLKSLFSFTFKEEIIDLSKLIKINSVEDYDFYKVNNTLYLYDSITDKTLKVKTWKSFSQKNFYSELITEYRYAYNIKWSGAIVNKQKLTAEDAKFIFEQSEKQLKDTTDTANNIVLRVNTIITIIVAIIVGLTSYIVSEWRKTCGFDNVLLTSSIGVLYFYFLGFFAVRSIYPTSYFIIGSIPKDLFSDSFFLNVIPNDERIIRYYVSEIENYQYRIERNNYTIGKRWKLYKRLLWALLSSPIVFLLTYFFISRS